MTMTEAPPMSSTAPGSRLVTVDDLRYEMQRERAITDAHFIRITSHVESLDQRLTNLAHDMNRRFDEAREHTDQRFALVDTRFAEAREYTDQRFASVDARFEQIDKRFAEAREYTGQRFEQVDARFDRLETRFEARFDAIEERLRFNKTLIVASFSAVASVASVVVSLLK
ncbi:MAG: hypothetical protein EBZ46_07440 [Actinobacteria bacterium]|nr:hypothetical protein [Actinomycetota bacterium]